MKQPLPEVPEAGARRILVVDGETAVRREVRQACEQDGFEVGEAETGADALREFEDAQPALVVLEVTLPDMSGFDVCREIRKTDTTTPVIMVSSRSDEIDVVVGLEIGADDYVTKPLRLRELLARIAAHLRKSRMEAFDYSRGRLEFKDLVIDVHIRNLRRKIEPQPARPFYILAVPGIGYRFTNARPGA